MQELYLEYEAHLSIVRALLPTEKAGKHGKFTRSALPQLQEHWGKMAALIQKGSQFEVDPATKVKVKKQLGLNDDRFV